MTLRGAIAISLAIHVALLSGALDEAVERAVAPGQAGHPNLTVVVRPTAGDASRMSVPAKRQAPVAPETQPRPVVATAPGSQHLAPAAAPTGTLVASPPSERPAGNTSDGDARPQGGGMPATGQAPTAGEGTKRPEVQVQTDSEDLRSYRMHLASAAGRYKEYPAIARERGLEGVVGVRVRIGAGHARPEVSLGQSSGFRVLDEAALAMIGKATAAVELPPRLRGSGTELDLPVDYRLD